MSRSSPLPRLPFLLLGALTLVTFGGPPAMLLIVRGGPRADWPPDRAVEWIVIGGVFALAALLFAACVSVGRWHPGLRRAQKPTTPAPGPSNRSISS